MSAAHPVTARAPAPATRKPARDPWFDNAKFALVTLVVIGHMWTLLSDADLAVLAAPPDRYASYVAGVREEYAHLDEETFRRGRAQVLASFAERPALFSTDHARDRWEAAARANLASELAGLGGVVAG